MTREDQIGLGRTHTAFWHVRVLLATVVVGSGAFLFSTPLIAQDDIITTPPISRKDITFVDSSGRTLPVQEVQRRMVAFNQATRKTLQELGTLPPHAQKLKVISFNAGLLHPGPLVNVPKYQERSHFLIPALQSADFDILCLQEVFYAQDLARLKRFAAENGYYFYRGRINERNRHGVVILVKKSLAAEAPVFQERRYRIGAWYESVFGYQKAIISATIKLVGGRTLAVTNTHLTAYLEAEHIRNSQVRGMLRVIDSLNADYVIVAGDLNSTLEPLPGHNGLTVTQHLVSRYHLVDSYSVAHPGKNEPTVSFPENPTAKYGFSTNLGHTGEERIDFVLATSRKKEERHVLIEDTQRVFMEDIPVKIKPPLWGRWVSPPIRGPEKNCKLSDHFGLLADITLF